jgi:sugar diacid utilization regulator
MRTLERTAQIMGLLILKETAVAEAEERVRGELLTELLVSAPPVSPSQRARAQARGIDIQSLDVLVVAESPTRSPADVARRLRTLASEAAGLAGEHLGRATLLLHSTDTQQTAKALHSRLRRELGAPVRVVAERVTEQRWDRAFALANKCSTVMQGLGVADRGATADDYALFGLLFDPERGQDLDRFIGDSIEPLLTYDELRSTQLVGTLTAYFQHGGNLTRTAAVLHVHMNTVLKRLDRVAAILGDDWREPDRALQLQVALRLHALRLEGR